MDLSLYSGTFGFAKGATTILTNAEMANYPYEPEQFGKTNRGRTESGARYRYDHWEGTRKHRWTLHFVNETQAVTDTLATYFNSSGTFFFNPNPGESEWYEVDNADDEWRPVETYIGLFSFDVTIEEV